MRPSRDQLQRPPTHRGLLHVFHDAPYVAVGVEVRRTAGGEFQQRGQDGIVRPAAAVPPEGHETQGDEKERPEDVVDPASDFLVWHDVCRVEVPSPEPKEGLAAEDEEEDKILVHSKFEEGLTLDGESEDASDLFAQTDALDGPASTLQGRGGLARLSFQDGHVRPSRSRDQPATHQGERDLEHEEYYDGKHADAKADEVAKAVGKRNEGEQRQHAPPVEDGQREDEEVSER